MFVDRSEQGTEVEECDTEGTQCGSESQCFSTMLGREGGKAAGPDFSWLPFLVVLGFRTSYLLAFTWL